MPNLTAKRYATLKEAIENELHEGLPVGSLRFALSSSSGPYSLCVIVTFNTTNSCCLTSGEAEAALRAVCRAGASYAFWAVGVEDGRLELRVHALFR